MTDKAETELKACFDRLSYETSHSDGCEVTLELGARTNLCDCDRDFRIAKKFAALSRPTQTADAVEAAANAIQNAVLDDGEGNKSYLFDLLGFSGENKSRIIARQLAEAALSTSDDSGDREEVEPVAWMYEYQNNDHERQIILRRARQSHGKNWKETPLYTHPLTPQDSGLADELEALDANATPAPFYELGSPWHNGKPAILSESPDPHVARYIADFDFTGLVDEDDKLSEQPEADAALLIKLRNHVPEICAALRQPRNDGELLREARDILEGADDWAPEGYFGVSARPSDMVEFWEKKYDHIKRAFDDYCDRIDLALARLDQGEG